MSATGTTKRVTTVEIARQAKVSRAAVYAVLNADKATSIVIGQETRQRILDIAARLGYVRNEVARSLVTGKSYTIGMQLRSLANQFLATQFYTDFSRSCTDSAYRQAYSVFLSSSEFDFAREARNLQALLAKRVDAVIVERGEPGEHDAVLRQMQAQGITVILLGEVDVPGLPYPVVGFDEPLAGRLAAEHLWSLGHRRILYFNAGKVRDNSLRVHTIRRELFQRAWQGLGGGGVLPGFATADPLHGGMELAEYLMQLPRAQWPTAVACSMDSLAISLSVGLRAHRIKVPREMAIVGCDDIPGAVEAAVPLTTVRLPTEKMAQGVWELLEPRLKDGGLPAGALVLERLVIAPELMIRQSTRTATLKEEEAALTLTA
jgi:LacI family transcriptional regulator